MSDPNVKLKYEFLERRVRGQAFVDIFKLPLPVPRYSFKLGSARVTYDGNGEQQITIIPFLNAFSYIDAAQLLLDVGAESEARRSEAKAASTAAINAHVQDQNVKWQKR